MKLNKPKSWDNVTLEQLIEIKSLNPSDFETSTGFQVQRICILSSVELEELDDLTLEEVMLYPVETAFTAKDPKTYKEEVEGFVFKGFKNLTLGEFIDLDFYCSKDFIEKAPEILSILYRKQRTNEWGSTVLEPLSEINIESRAEEMRELIAGDVYAAVTEYLKFREEFMQRFREEFGLEDDDEEDEYEDEEQRKKEDHKQKLLKKWSWELFLYNLCKGDLTKLDAVTELNLQTVFLFTKMKRELKLDY